MVDALRQLIDNPKALVSVKSLDLPVVIEVVALAFDKTNFPSAEDKQRPEELTLIARERKGQKAIVDTTSDSDWSAVCQTLYDGV